MDLERRMEKNLRNDGSQDEHQPRLEVSAEQVRLTEEMILPYEEMIITDLLELREQADAILVDEQYIKAREVINENAYPLGFCGQIRDEIWDQMEESILDRSRPGLKPIRNFIKAGGVVSKFWAVDTRGYFQNAIQIGSAVIDVANDTVESEVIEAKVVFYPEIAESPFRPLDNFSDLADVLEKYREADVYPNKYLPAFAPLFPLVAVLPLGFSDGKKRPGIKGLYLISEGFEEIFRNTHNEVDESGRLFKAAYDFIKHSQYAEKELPPRVYEQLFKSPTLKKLKHMFSEYGDISNDPEGLELAFSRFYKKPINEKDREKIKEDFQWLNVLGKEIAKRPIIFVSENGKPLDI